jgi:hypothetical protein
VIRIPEPVLADGAESKDGPRRQAEEDLGNGPLVEMDVDAHLFEMIHRDRSKLAVIAPYI